MDSAESGRALLRILQDYAKEHGLTVKQAFDIAYYGFEDEARKKEWGTMPDEYDPLGDESHPSREWKPEP